jgi:hypothetical protein
MKSKEALSEIAESMKPETISVSFPTTTRQYSTISSPQGGVHARKSDHPRWRACRVSGRQTSKMRMTASRQQKTGKE